jgi:hypothetical protein
MRARFNDGLRTLMAFFIRLWGLFMSHRFEWQLKHHARTREERGARHGLGPDVAIERWGPVVQARIEEKAGDASPLFFATTSGSTSTPKRVYYPPARLRRVKALYMAAFGRLYSGLGISRTSLYVFSTLAEDDSLTSRMMAEKGSASLLSLLQAPYRVHSHPALVRVRERHGTTAARLWVLVLSNPGVLYATNPSTLSTFFDALSSEWQACRGFIADFLKKDASVDRALYSVSRKLVSGGFVERLNAIAEAEHCPPLSQILPGCTHVVCWDGGYVEPFLKRLSTHLPPERFERVPMYSMSTEVVETQPRIRGGRLSFVPHCRGVFYEFLPLDCAHEPNPDALLGPAELSPGEDYLMVVSDEYGLRRYLTDDVFHCQAMDRGIPDLRFLRRHALSYSFTGEKLTGAHLETVFREVRREIAELEDDDFLTCIPSHPSDEKVPHYKLILVRHQSAPGEKFVQGPALCASAQKNLRQTNAEYAAKIKSGRLAPLRFVEMTRDEFLERMAPGGKAGGWEAQFKFLPLYRTLWEKQLSPPRSWP